MVKPSKLQQIIPDLFPRCPKNMCSISVYLYTIPIFSVTVSSNMPTTLQNQAFLSRFHGLMGKHCTV